MADSTEELAHQALIDQLGSLEAALDEAIDRHAPEDRLNSLHEQIVATRRKLVY